MMLARLAFMRRPYREGLGLFVTRSRTPTRSRRIHDSPAGDMPVQACACGRLRELGLRNSKAGPTGLSQRVSRLRPAACRRRGQVSNGVGTKATETSPARRGIATRRCRSDCRHPNGARQSDEVRSRITSRARARRGLWLKRNAVRVVAGLTEAGGRNAAVLGVMD